MNHYYKFEVEAEDGALPIENHYFDQGDAGSFINAAGVGVLASAANPEGAASFADYLTGEPGQTFVAEDPRGVSGRRGLRGLGRRAPALRGLSAGRPERPRGSPAPSARPARAGRHGVRRPG